VHVVRNVTSELSFYDNVVMSSFQPMSQFLIGFP